MYTQKGQMILKTKLNKKKGGIISGNVNCIAAAVISSVIMLFAYIVWEFFPFGSNIILRMDLYHQYAPLFAELYERIFGGDSLLYSFTSGLGSCFLGNYFNYLSSPAMLFVMIFGHFDIPEAVAAMVLVKAAASSFTFTYFISKVFGKKDLSTAGFGILYAFCGYFVAYYWNIMWLDAVVVFPLVILGVWNIINKGKSTAYIVSLAYVMLTNYYMAYMTCILSVIFFLYFYFSQNVFSEKIHTDIILKSKYKKVLGAKLVNSKLFTTGINFAFSSLVSALIAGVALLPVFFILQNSSATNSSFPSSFSTYFTVFDFFANHLAGVEPTIRSSGDAVYPNIYCGIITLILVPLFMFSKRFSVKEKIATAAVTAFFFLSFNINFLNYIWHGFHFPNDLPYRFSFAYSFFLLFIAFKVFTQLDKISSRDILSSAALVAGFAVIVEKVESANVDLTVVWTSIIFAVIYAVVLIFMKTPKYIKSSISILLLTCICAEILIADTPNYKVTQTKDAYTNSYNDTQAAIDIIKSNEDENSFYRMELASLLTRMDNSWFYYNGVSTFTSMAYEDVAHLQDYLGLYGNKINSYTYNCQTPLYNSMMSVKYLVDNSTYVPTDNYKPPLADDYAYTKIDKHNDMVVYKNNYWLPLAFGVDAGTENSWNYDDDNPFEVQNNFYYCASGVDDILVPINGSLVSSSNIDPIEQSSIDNGSFSAYKTNTSEAKSEAEFSYEIDKTQNVYLYFECLDVESILVTAGDFVYNQSISNKPYVLNLGSVEAGETVTINFSLKDNSISGSVKQRLVALDKDKLDDAYKKILSNGTLDVTVNKESYIKGTVNLAKGKMLYTSIPYDEGWSVFVDGEKLDDENIVKIGNALIGIKLDSGEHTVEFKYMPTGLILGLLLTLLGIIILILLIISKKKGILMHSESFKRDILMLERWRDKAAEAERDLAIENEKEQMELMIKNSENDEFVNNDTDTSWAAALQEAENYARNISFPDDDSFEDISSESEMPVENESEADLTDDIINEYLTEQSLDEVLDEFEKNTDDISKINTPRISAEDKKSAQKKRLNVAVFVVLCIIAVSAGLFIIIYAALTTGNNEPPEQSNEYPEITFEDNDDTSENASIIDVPESESETPTEHLTERTTESTTERTTEHTTTTTTKAPEVNYTGAFELYTVKSGDNYYSILRSFNVRDTHENVRIFCAFNGITVNTALRVGQTLKVPTEL